MSTALLLVATLFYVGGLVELFRTTGPRGRLRGVTAMVLGGLVLVAAGGPNRGPALAAAAVSGLTLAGLLLVARAMERHASRDGDADLHLDVDPLRWR